jgi:excisionase family DNA binding protein
LQSTQPTGTLKAFASIDVPRARRVNAACASLGIGRTTLYKLANDGKIKLVHVLGRTLVPESEIERLASEGVE